MLTVISVLLTLNLLKFIRGHCYQGKPNSKNLGTVIVKRETALFFFFFKEQYQIN